MVLDTSNAAKYKNNLTREQVLMYKIKPKVSRSKNNSIKFLYLSSYQQRVAYNRRALNVYIYIYN
jgi:hypothetical protein